MSVKLTRNTKDGEPVIQLADMPGLFWPDRACVRTIPRAALADSIKMITSLLDATSAPLYDETLMGSEVKGYA